MSKVIVDGLPSFELDQWEEITEPCPNRREILKSLDLSIRSRLAKLSLVDYWKVVGHSSCIHLLDRMANMPDNPPDRESDDAYAALLNALEYVLTKVERTAKRQGKGEKQS